MLSLMKKIIRVLLILLGLFVLALACTPLLGTYLLRRYVDKEFLVLQTERSINARVSLDDVNLTLFAWPPSLRLSGIKIAPRDAFAGRPLAERPPLADAPVNIEVAYAELMAEELWHRRFMPKIIRFIGVDVRESINPRDGSSLEKLFLPPEASLVVADAEVPRAIPYQPGRPLPEPLPESVPVPRAQAVPAPPAGAGSEQPNMPEAPVGEAAAAKSNKATRFALREISIEQGRFRITNERADARFDGEMSEFSLSITDIDIDPDHLERHNNLVANFSTHVVLDGVAQINGQMQTVRFADMRLKGAGNVNPVDPRTMTWSPAAALKLVIAKGSTVGGHMTIGDAAGNNLDKLMKYGVDLRGIRVGGELAEDLALNILSRDQGIKFLEDAHLALPDYEFTIKRDSWMDFAKDDQGLLTRLYCGEALKEQIVRGIASRGLGETISRMVVNGMSDDRGRISFDLTITGTLSHPEVKPDIQLKVESLLGNDIESKAKKLLENESVGGLLKGLLKKL